MTNYANGSGLEYDTRDLMYASGAVHVVRSAGSHGCVDIVAFFPKFVLCIQCKKGKGKVSKEEVAKLTALARNTGKWLTVIVVSKKNRGNIVVESVIKRA